MRTLATERCYLFNGKGFKHDWNLAYKPYNDPIEFKHWEDVKKEFLDIFYNLYKY